MPIKVGCRDYAEKSLYKILSALDIIETKRKRAIKNITETVEKALRWLWIRRKDPWGGANAT